MKPSATKKPATQGTATIASSLGGTDRHLAIRTMDRNMAGDFEIGPLASDTIDPGLATLLAALEAALKIGSLPYELFDESAATMARLMYAEALLSAPTIVATRFSAPRSAPGGTTSVELRIFSEPASETDDADDRDGARGSSKAYPSAIGLTLLSSDEKGTWRIEHFELDMAALNEPAAPREPWDPYATASPR